MIVEALLNFFLAPVYLLLDAIDFSLAWFTIPPYIFNGLNNLFGLIGYIFPVNQLLPILTLSISLTFASLAVTFVRSLLSLIPIFGSHS